LRHHPGPDIEAKECGSFQRWRNEGGAMRLIVHRKPRAAKLA
jgi:hypothetical protein